MGIRIKRAIGYGIPINEDTKHMFSDDDFIEDFYESDLANKTIEDFFKEKYVEEIKILQSGKGNLFNQTSDRLDIDLLFLLKYITEPETHDNFGKKYISDCISFVSPYDAPNEGFISFPPMYIKQWSSYNEPLDYAFAKTNSDGCLFVPTEDNPGRALYPFPPYDILDKELKFGSYDMARLANDYLYKGIQGGIVEEFIAQGKVRNHIPASLRIILEEIKVFKDPNAIFALTPYKAEWWT